MMIFNHERYRSIIEQFYEDTATIKRLVETETEWGETKLIEQIIYQDVPCKLSQRGLAMNNQTDTVNKIEYETKLFIAPEIEIKQGDVVEVTRSGATRKYTAGEPFIYATHQEISLERKEKA